MKQADQQRQFPDTTSRAGGRDTKIRACARKDSGSRLKMGDGSRYFACLKSWDLLGVFLCYDGAAGES